VCSITARTTASSDLAVVQVHADFVADLELSIIWLLWLGWHARPRLSLRFSEQNRDA
jgi:hypothetical protein